MPEEAALSGVARLTWWRWEHGRSRPTVAQLEAVAARWGVGLEALQRAPADACAVAPVRSLVERHGEEPVAAALAMVSGRPSGVL